MDDAEVTQRIEELRAKRGRSPHTAEEAEEAHMKRNRPLKVPEENENFDNAEKKKKAGGISGIVTFQAILSVIIAILYAATLSFASSYANSISSNIKDKIKNDFSFHKIVSAAAKNAITYLNHITPIENGGVYSSGSDNDEANNTSSKSVNVSVLNGKGGVFLPVSGHTLPSNITLAPVVFTGSIGFPIKGGGKITSGFTFRDSPIYNKPEFHNGVDIAAPEGTNIAAVFDGVVKKRGTDPSLGNYIVLDHGHNFYTTYGHCSKLIAECGAHIRKGEIIAKVGSTGHSTGYHLHFSMQKNGLYFDPAYVFPQYIKK